MEEIDVPALILGCGEDAFLLPEDVELVYNKARNSKLKIFSPKIKHMIQFEALEESAKW